MELTDRYVVFTITSTRVLFNAADGRTGSTPRKVGNVDAPWALIATMRQELFDGWRFEVIEAPEAS